MFQSIILSSIKQIHQQRSMSAIYHLLTGKRSLQTVQDAHLFGLEKFYGVLPSLSRQEYDQFINKLIQAGDVDLAKKESTLILKIMEPGKQVLVNKQTRLTGLNGLHFYKVDEIFYKRLLLYVQVLTNHMNNHSSYIPIIEDPDVLQWMKRQFNHVKHRISAYLNQLYDDLYMLLKEVSTPEAEMFVDRLTSYKSYGLSLQQLSIKYNESTINIRLILKAIIHQILTAITEKKIETKLLINFMSDLPHFNVLTQSAQTTHNLLLKQYSVEQIATIRRLKENTINDHIVEICWYDQSFPIEQFIDEKTIYVIKRAIRTSNSLQLKTIKAMIPDHITYFQIQLALTRIKNVFAESVNADDTR